MPLGKKGPRPLGDICQFRRAAVPQIFRRREGEQFGDKSFRHGGLPVRQEPVGGRDNREDVTLVAACGIGLSVHVCSAYDAQ
jgi:hypothetical protein